MIKKNLTWITNLVTDNRATPPFVQLNSGLIQEHEINFRKQLIIEYTIPITANERYNGWQRSR